jgi:antitoxin component YwqK of YwqJK toxin-antitoxin module
VYESKGKGKLYNDLNDELLFEGEFVNGKIWKGKGKEYFEDGKVKFEGEYLNGKKMKKGKLFDKAGFIEFEGEFVNGEKWNGKGREYKEVFRISDKFLYLYEGEYLNGKRNGKGKIYVFYGRENKKFEGCNNQKALSEKQVPHTKIQNAWLFSLCYFSLTSFPVICSISSSITTVAFAHFSISLSI